MMMDVVWRRQKRRKSHIDEANQRAMDMPIKTVRRAWLWLESIEDQVPADVSRVV